MSIIKTYNEFLNEIESRPYENTEFISQAYKVLYPSQYEEILNSEQLSFYRENPNLPKIYRGIGTNKSYLLFDGKNTNSTRISVGNMSNIYTLLIDNLPSWNNYPKRSKSLICTFSKKYAQKYGNYYQVIPFNNTKLAIAPKIDIWNVEIPDLSYSKDIPSPNLNTYLNSFAQIMSEELDLNPEESKKINWLELVDKLKDKYDINNIDDIITLSKEYGFRAAHIYLLEQFKKSGKNIVEFLNDILNPNKLKIRLDSYNNNFSSNVKANEVWLEGPALLVKLFKKDKKIQYY